MTIPRPGTPVRGSRSGRPIMALLDLLGRRWTLRVLWELREGPETFRGLRARCDDVSPSVLNTRLRELRAAGVVSSEAAAGYTLTADGIELLRALRALDSWAKTWARRQAGRAARRTPDVTRLGRGSRGEGAARRGEKLPAASSAKAGALLRRRT